MDNSKIKSISFIFIYLLLTSISMAIPFSILIQLETNQPETINLSVFDSIITIPFYLTCLLFPYTLLVKVASYFLKLIINKFVEMRSNLFDVVIFITLFILPILFLPRVLNIIVKTEFNYLINPYLFIPFIGALTMTFLENKKYKNLK